MRLYLIQHGEAADESVDLERRLTARGRRDVERVSDALARAGVRIPLFVHSGKARAAQTAEILAERQGDKPAIEQAEGLNPKDPPGSMARRLREQSGDMAVVGHLPHLGRLASSLLLGNDRGDVIAFQKGGVVCLERDPEGVWRVRWMLTPELADVGR